MQGPQKQNAELLIKPRTIMLRGGRAHRRAAEPQHMEEVLIKFDCEPPTDHLSSFRSVEEPLQEEELYLQQLLC